eukprot:TRINITY_DN1261_c0_g1_i1.p1 TRINITY_DN1261_c0_g1~~TRINITY_DN1261_c0_g1_i1.p1  ORF type:complete len:440 (-),score=209.16 TRINITY_DN1261_c0_g1_i1:140-1459(-)
MTTPPETNIFDNINSKPEFVAPFHQPYAKLALILVGLPGRGKSYLSSRISRYLSWLGYDTKIFNLSDYRRREIGNVTHSFFDETNEEGARQLQHMADEALEDLLNYFREPKTHQIGILDGTNIRRSRRKIIHDACINVGVEVLFVESVCNDSDTIEAMVLAARQSPDYQGVNTDEAREDFKKRISHFQKFYETLDVEIEKNYRFIKLVDICEQVIAHRVNGYVQSRTAFLLLNIHLQPRPIYLTRHGQSQYNLFNKIGGNADLTDLGQQFSKALSEWIPKHETQPFKVWTSTLKRTINTARPLNRFCSGPIIQWRALDEINAGICDGLSYDQIKQQYPEEFAARARDKLRYRYPQGESYIDVVQRVDSVIVELERQTCPVLVICHQAVMRTLYAYFMNRGLGACPFIEAPLHTVVKLIPYAYGCKEEHFQLMSTEGVHD